MAWLAPLLGLVGAGFGASQSAQNDSLAQQAAQEQNAIAAAQLSMNQQSQKQKMQIMQQLFPFFQQYMQQGSPFLQNIQSQAAGQNAQQFGNAAGQLRQNMQTSGMGYGPSGATASALGQLGQGAAQNSVSNYLQNLLANEQVKFQAAQGQQGLGNMFNFGGQGMPTTQPVQTTLGSSINAAGQSLGNLIGQGQQQGQGNPGSMQLPTTLPGGAPPNIGLPNPNSNPSLSAFTNPLGVQGFQA